MLRHRLVLVTEQLLRVLQIFRVGRRLCADIPKLEAHAGCLACFVESRAQRKVGQALPVFILNK
jgi:hypothetical protein